MPELIPVLSETDIETSVSRIADRISNDYKNQKPLVIGVLKGAFIFLADLLRKLAIETQVDFISVSSYGSGTETSGKVSITKDIRMDVANRHILIVEDIVDSGITLQFLINRFQKAGAASVRICTLIDKKERRQTDVRIDYACHEIAEGFLVGYGLDYAENYRHLPAIYHLKFNE